MDSKIVKFINQHFVLTLATVVENLPHVSNMFYAYLEEENSLVFSSDEHTKHIQDVLINPTVGINIVLETKVVGKIQGLQCVASVSKVESGSAAQRSYFKKFPYAIAMNPTLWRAEIIEAKFTDNRLGFGKKLLWKRGENNE